LHICGISYSITNERFIIHGIYRYSSSPEVLKNLVYKTLLPLKCSHFWILEEVSADRNASDIQGIAKMTCGSWGAWGEEAVFIEHLWYARNSLIFSDVTKPGFLLIVQSCV